MSIRPRNTRELPRDPDDALEHLASGNERFVAASSSEAARGAERRGELVGGQSPFAAILGCADSRVAPEVVFDQGLGDLFVVRVAGNTAAAPAIVGSVEYAVESLGCALVVVLGHEGCGAVEGAVGAVTAGLELPGSIGDVVDPIVPVVERVSESESDASAERLLELSVRANAQATIGELRRRSALIAERSDSGELRLVAAEYRLGSGEVELL